MLPALRRGETDAVIASHAVSANALRIVDFTDRYYHTPARFAGKRSAGRLDATPEGFEGKIVIEPQGITIQAPTITVKGAATIDVTAPMTTVTGGAMLVLQGGIIKIN